MRPMKMFMKVPFALELVITTLALEGNPGCGHVNVLNMLLEVTR